MKINTNQRLLFSLVLFEIGFAAVVLSFDAPTQVHLRPTQLGYGHAPHLTQGKIQANKQTQPGFGHASSPTQGAIQADKQTYR